ncbi:hypothetical protein PINS_up001228 [Pythium insidiosum]|nr:hypothetical protein PINS_up001228 [Pythium insidiosum]
MATQQHETTRSPYNITSLGAWFGASQPAPALTTARQMGSAVERDVHVNDSQDDAPLSTLLQRRQMQTQAATQRRQSIEDRPLRDWKQEKQLQRAQKNARTTASRTGFQTASEVNRSAAATSTGFQRASEADRNAAIDRSSAKLASNEDERVFQLSSKRRVTVRRWKSTPLIDIREYYDDNGVTKPGKKGISLSKDQWQTLLRLAREIDEAVALVEDDSVDPHSLHHVKERIVVPGEERTIAFTLSSKRRITVRFFRTSVLVDLREYYEQGNEMKPGKKGISLSKEQWRSLIRMESDIREALDEI